MMRLLSIAVPKPKILCYMDFELSGMSFIRPPERTISRIWKAYFPVNALNDACVKNEFLLKGRALEELYRGSRWSWKDREYLLRCYSSWSAALYKVHGVKHLVYHSCHLLAFRIALDDVVESPILHSIDGNLQVGLPRYHYHKYAWQHTLNTLHGFQTIECIHVVIDKYQVWPFLKRIYAALRVFEGSNAIAAQAGEVLLVGAPNDRIIVDDKYVQVFDSLHEKMCLVYCLPPI
jgi:hypothetical protein